MKYLIVAFLIVFSLGAPEANAKQLDIVVDVSEQRMYVYRWGKHTHTWSVSTARSGKWTPRGSFRPYLMHRKHYSSLYNNAPMPHSIFFRGNYAIHGTYQTKRLGRPASAGCVRLAPGNAKKLYEYVRHVGMGATKIRVRD